MAALSIHEPDGDDGMRIVGNDGYGNAASNAMQVNSDGAIKIDWTNCPISEDSIRGMAKEEAKDVLRLKTKELQQELDNDTPIRILRRKVQDWLRS